MSEKFSSPIEQVRFARIEFRRALVLMDRLQGILQLLLYIAQLVMKLCASRVKVRSPLQVRNRGSGVSDVCKRLTKLSIGLTIVRLTRQSLSPRTFVAGRTACPGTCGRVFAR